MGRPKWTLCDFGMAQIHETFDVNAPTNHWTFQTMVGWTIVHDLLDEMLGRQVGLVSLHL